MEPKYQAGSECKQCYHLPPTCWGLLWQHEDQITRIIFEHKELIHEGLSQGQENRLGKRFERCPWKLPETMVPVLVVEKALMQKMWNQASTIEPRLPQRINQEVSEDNVTNSLINVKHYGGSITEIILELKKMCSGIRRKDNDNIIQIIPLELRCQHKMELMLIIIAHRIYKRPSYYC